MTDDNDPLERMFEAARKADPVPDAALVERVLADAGALRPGPIRRGAGRGAWPGMWRGWLRELGGWPAVTGLGAAALAGVWIGSAPGEALIGGALGLSVEYGIDAGPETWLALGEDFAS